MESNSRTARISIILAISGVATCVLGPLLAQLAVVPPMIAFLIFAVGLLDCLLALIVGAVGMWKTRSATGRGGRGLATAGMLLGAIPLAIAVAVSGSAGDVPRINDITTDPNDPPGFRAAQTDAANAGRDLGYPGTEFATAQRAAYPDLEPLRIPGSRADVYARCLAAAEGLGWQITQRDAENTSFEAVDVSRLFRFVDDIAVRVRSVHGEVIVDVRSKSRDGKSDLGANAARIRTFRSALTD
jgi:hypothetical protein